MLCYNQLILFLDILSSNGFIHLKIAIARAPRSRVIFRDRVRSASDLMIIGSRRGSDTTEKICNRDRVIGTIFSRGLNLELFYI